MDQASPSPQSGDLNRVELAARLNARYRTPLMNYFLRRARNPEDAEDLTQEVFLRILRRDGAVPLENAEVFIFHIAGNLLRDRARRAGAHRLQSHASIDAPERQFQNSGLLVDGLVEDRGPERVLLSQESLADVLRALDALGERTRDIFMMFRLEKLKHREIAALYGVSVSAVEKHIAKAVVHLARTLGPL